MPKIRSAYRPEFRRQMVELVRAGRTPHDLAQELEPCYETIHAWVQQADRDEGRSNRHQIGDFGKGDMLNRKRVGQFEHAGRHRQAGDGAERGRADKLGRRFRHHRMDGNASLRQLARQIDRLVRGNRSADSENNVFFSHFSPFTDPAGLYKGSEAIQSMSNAKHSQLHHAA